MDYNSALQEVEKCGVKLQDGEKVQLRKVHGARNYAQHRAVIPELNMDKGIHGLGLQVYEAILGENFEIDLDSMIPLKWIFVFVVEEVRGSKKFRKIFKVTIT